MFLLTLSSTKLVAGMSFYKTGQAVLSVEVFSLASVSEEFKLHKSILFFILFLNPG